MATTGRRQLTYDERIKLFRDEPRDVRFYNNKLTEQYKGLILSFTKEEYQAYEKLLHTYKKVEPLLNHCKNKKISVPILELATIRASDLNTHQRLVQMLRHRWTNNFEKQKNALNCNSNKFWYRMAGHIQARCRDSSIELFPSWQGELGRQNLVIFLQTQFESQNGLCAISNYPMDLSVGVNEKNYNKCSPDRKDSSKGYTPENLWFVAWWVNQMKMDTPIEKFRERIEILFFAQNNVNNTLT